MEIWGLIIALVFIATFFYIVKLYVEITLIIILVAVGLAISLYIICWLLDSFGIKRIVILICIIIFVVLLEAFVIPSIVRSPLYERSKKESISVFLYNVPQLIIWEHSDREYTLQKNDYVIMKSVGQGVEVSFRGSIDEEFNENKPIGNLASEHGLKQPIRLTIREYSLLEPMWSKKWQTMS